MNTKIIILGLVLLGVIAIGLQYYLNNYGGAAVFQEATSDIAECSTICQQSCQGFATTADTDQCLQQCAQLCAQSY